MTTNLKDLINKAYSALTKETLTKHFQRCNQMYNGQKPGKAAI